MFLLPGSGQIALSPSYYELFVIFLGNIFISLSSREFQVLNRIGLGCVDLDTLCIKDHVLTSESKLNLTQLKTFKKYVMYFSWMFLDIC